MRRNQCVDGLGSRSLSLREGRREIDDGSRHRRRRPRLARRPARRLERLDRAGQRRERQPQCARQPAHLRRQPPGPGQGPTAVRPRAAGRGRADRRLPGGLQGAGQALQGPLQAAAVRARRLRLGRAADQGAHRALLDRRVRGDLPDDGGRQAARAAGRAAVFPGHTAVPAGRPAGRRRWPRSACRCTACPAAPATTR